MFFFPSFPVPDLLKISKAPLALVVHVVFVLRCIFIQFTYEPATPFVRFIVSLAQVTA